MTARARVLTLTMWSYEKITFRARPTNAPPRASGVPHDARYFAARVAERSGTESVYEVPMEVWEIMPDGTVSASDWSSTNTRSKRTTIEGDRSALHVDDMLHLWRWKVDGVEHSHIIRAHGVRYA